MLKLYNSHTEKTLVGISTVRMELMFNENILGQYLTLTSDVISWVQKEHEIMSDKRSEKHVFHVRKTIQFSETKEAANTDCSNKHSY